MEEFCDQVTTRIYRLEAEFQDARSEIQLDLDELEESLAIENESPSQAEESTAQRDSHRSEVQRLMSELEAARRIFRRQDRETADYKVTAEECTAQNQRLAEDLERLNSTNNDQSQELVILQQSKAEVEALSSLKSHFLLSYMSTAHNVEHIEESLIDRMMEAVKISSTQRPLIGVINRVPRMDPFGRTSQQYTRPDLAAAFHLWASVHCGSYLSLQGAEIFFNQLNIPADQIKLSPWIRQTLSRAIQRLPTQQVISENTVKTFLLIIQGIGYLHSMPKISASEESSQDLLAALITWFSYQPISHRPDFRQILYEIDKLINEPIHVQINGIL